MVRSVPSRGFAALTRARVEIATLQQENARLQTQLRLAEAARVSEGVTLSPPLPAESNKLIVCGLHVASNVMLDAQFAQFCTEELHLRPAPLVAAWTLLGVDSHGLSSVTVRLQSVAEAKRVLQAAKQYLNPSSTVSVDWNRTRAQRNARIVAWEAMRRSQRQSGGSPPPLNPLAAVFQPAAGAHLIATRTMTPAPASGLINQE
jgi:hypothetical protein